MSKGGLFSSETKKFLQTTFFPTKIANIGILFANSRISGKFVFVIVMKNVSWHNPLIWNVINVQVLEIFDEWVFVVEIMGLHLLLNCNNF